MAAEQPEKALPIQEMLVAQYTTAHVVEYPATEGCIDTLIRCYVDLGLCDTAGALLASIQIGGANRPAVVNQHQQTTRGRRYRDLIQRVKPAADAYQQALAAKKADHPDALAARPALAVILQEQKRLSAAASVLDVRQHLLGADHPDTQAYRLQLGDASSTTEICRVRAAASRCLCGPEANPIQEPHHRGAPAVGAAV